MSKICENCGNMIPDGADVCPGCGRQQYSEDALKSVFDELTVALGDIQGNDTPREKVMEVKEAPAPRRVDPAIAAISAQNVMQNQPKQPKKVSDSTVQQQTKSNSSKKKAKKKKRRNSGGGSTVIAIIVGILIALLLVAGAAVFMLYQMGFFELLSDDELLRPETTVESTLENVVVSETPVEPSPVVEESVVEEAPVEDSAEEGIVIPEVSVEEPEETEGTEVTRFVLTGADSMTFYSRGETAEIVYVISPEDAKYDIEWTSSDENVATVSDLGVIAARRGGECTITGTCGDQEVNIQVICSFEVPTTVLDMNYSDITMDHEGQEVQLKIDYELTDDEIKNILWESTDPAVATVDEDGLVTAIADGTVVISASIGDYTASCIVRCVNVTGNKGVNPDDSEYVINYEDVTLTRKGEYFQLNLKSILGNEVPDFTWKSSDKSVATVDSKGVVTAVGDGTCKITTTVGGDDFECIVRVRISG